MPAGCGNSKRAKGSLSAKAATKFNAIDTVSESLDVFFKGLTPTLCFKYQDRGLLKLIIIAGEDESDITKFIKKTLIGH